MQRSGEHRTLPDVSIGIDVGGTFIDIVVVDRAGGMRAVKVLTTPTGLAAGVMQGLAKVLGDGLAGAIPAPRNVHPTTTATAALLQGRPPAVGLINAAPLGE